MTTIPLLPPTAKYHKAAGKCTNAYLYIVIRVLEAVCERVSCKGTNPLVPLTAKCHKAAGECIYYHLSRSESRQVRITRPVWLHRQERQSCQLRRFQAISHADPCTLVTNFHYDVT